MPLSLRSSLRSVVVVVNDDEGVEDEEEGKRGTGEKGSLRDCMFTSKMMGSIPFFLGLPEK